MNGPDLVVRPVTPARWGDLEKLFGKNGAYSGCWCMFHRQTSAEYAAKAGAKNRAELQSIVRGRGVPGLIGYVDAAPAGWVSVSPRTQFGRIERSPLFKANPGDETREGVWSITCFFIHRDHRSGGIASLLLSHAVEHAAKKGARVVEGYPLDPAHKERWNSAEAYIGTIGMFERAGFEVAERRKPARPLMRRYL
jgi:GNAT superfamily N-acetyltransferase